MLKSVTLTVLMLFFAAEGAVAFQKSIKLSDVYKEVLDEGTQEFLFEDIRFIDDIESAIDLNDPDSLQFILALERVLNREISLTDGIIGGPIATVEAYDVRGTLTLSNLSIGEVTIESSEFDFLDLKYSEFEDVFLDSITVDEFYLDHSNFDIATIWYSHFQYAEYRSSTFLGLMDAYEVSYGDMIQVYDCVFSDGLFFQLSGVGDNTLFILSNNVFEPRSSDEYVVYEGDSLLFRTQLSLDYLGVIPSFTGLGNDFLSDGRPQLINLEGNFNDLVLTDNVFESSLALGGSVQNRLTFTGNSYHNMLSIAELNLAGLGHFRADIDSLLGFKLATTELLYDVYDYVATELGDTSSLIQSQIGSNFTKFINAEADIEHYTEATYMNLISDYYRIYDHYKKNGFHDYADKIYLEMKDVELKRLRAEFLKYGGMERLVEWTLNSILKFYTRYGTSPTRAIIVSFVVLVIFAIFYFFFPSEWDTRSKGQLLIEFKNLREKNDKGYVRPFSALMIGLAKSSVNAFSLSLNTFITLGFGSIPTTGIARYVCIFQGFLGWFLLSIFTASLIGQILY